MRLGLEEEVFITQPDRPNLQSLYYLSRLFWRNPGFFLVHSDSNFARGADLLTCVMGPVEISTPVAQTPSELMDMLKSLRQQLAGVVGNEGLLVAVGHLLDIDAPTLTAGLHLHLSDLPDAERAYSNLAHFLPLLALVSASSPARKGTYFGSSYRLHCSYALGALRSQNPYYRFQDMIISSRLGTIEVRLFDPVADIERLQALIQAVTAIATSKKRFPWDTTSYQKLREDATRGLMPSLERLWAELQEVCTLDDELVRRTASQKIWENYKENGLVSTYAWLDKIYRQSGQSTLAAQGVFDPLKAAAGLAGYYMVRLPYKLAKVRKEWSRC